MTLSIESVTDKLTDALLDMREISRAAVNGDVELDDLGLDNLDQSINALENVLSDSLEVMV